VIVHSEFLFAVKFDVFTVVVLGSRVLWNVTLFIFLHYVLFCAWDCLHKLAE